MHLINPARSAIACMAALLSMIGIAETKAQETPAVEPRLMMSHTYFHEAHDQDWELRLVGNVPSFPGMYLVLHDARGRLTLKRHVPHGQYAADEPLVIPIAKDDYAGDYRLIMLGYQEDIRGLHMPLSTLPSEVYGGKVFAARHAPPLYFKVPADVEEVRIRSSSAAQQVYQDDQVVLDTKADGEYDGRSWLATLKPRPDTAYNFRNLKVFYFGSPDGLLLCFDIKRWFAPGKKIDEVQWWKLTQ